MQVNNANLSMETNPWSKTHSEYVTDIVSILLKILDIPIDMPVIQIFRRILKAIFNRFKNVFCLLSAQIHLTPTMWFDWLIALLLHTNKQFKTKILNQAD